MRLSKNKNEFGLQWQNLIIDTGRATLDDLRDAVTTLEDIERIARRVFGGAHPITGRVGELLQDSRAVLAAREGDDVGAVRAGLDAMELGRNNLYI